jgi:hypothetical protein
MFSSVFILMNVSMRVEIVSSKALARYDLSLGNLEYPGPLKRHIL